MIVFDLNTNNAEALLRHVEEFKPSSGDRRARSVAGIERSFGVASGRRQHAS
ncbi:MULTISPECIES: hypothetical protein [Pseudomonas]|uniref:hypothetical protein n=1 Tax=Pseudomonas TaxID=286 RepID=UPI001F218742|nr:MULTISPECIES: hypothetical protein [Pseudomonas]